MTKADLSSWPSQVLMASLIRDSTEMSEEDVREWMNNLKTEISDLDMDKPVFQLAVSRDETIMKTVSDQIEDALLLKSSTCDPSDYQIKIISKGSRAKYWNIQISGKSDESFKHSNLLRLKTESKSSAENCSLQNLLLGGKAILVSQNELYYPVKAMIQEELMVSVKVMGKDIINSPITVNSEQNISSVNKNYSLESFSRELDNHYEKQGCSTYYF